MDKKTCFGVLLGSLFGLVVLSISPSIIQCTNKQEKNTGRYWDIDPDKKYNFKNKNQSKKKAKV